MTHDEAFLQAILESPDDDTPRLVYADWLDEHRDSARAELIMSTVGGTAWVMDGQIVRALPGRPQEGFESLTRMLSQRCSE